LGVISIIVLSHFGEEMNSYVASTLVIALLSVTMLGCAPAPFVSVGEDTYTISQTSAGGIFKSVSSLRTEVISRANAFAEGKGKVAVHVSEKGLPAWPGHMPSFTYTFRLVPRSAPAPGLDSATSNASKTDDVYERLLKLEDLRSKGIITQAEFETQKAKILSEK
jgi:hypothetical protein